MKQETNTMQTKEGLHLDRRLSGIYSGDKLIATLDLSDGNYSVYGDEIAKAVNERQALPELLKKIYHAIDFRCFSETENVSMTAIREELVKFGANEKDLW